MQRNDSRGGPRRWGLPALALLLVPVWFGVRWAVRVHVDGRIERMAGQPLPEFRLVGTDGEVYSPEVLRGRTVVLNFFRSRCVSCLAERDAVVELARSAGERVLVLGVMTDAALGFPSEESARTLELLGYRHPVLMADREFMDAFHGVAWSNVTPVTYIVDPNGRIVRTLRGTHTLAELRAAVEGLDPPRRR